MDIEICYLWLSQQNRAGPGGQTSCLCTVNCPTVRWWDVGAELVIYWCRMGRMGLRPRDRDKLEAYLSASERGAPFYGEHVDSEVKKQIDIPDRPAYGMFTYISHFRPVQSTAEK